MTEIEKMFKNAGINATARMKEIRENLFECGLFYPDFTAEKQLELIKWLANKFSFFAIEFNFNEWSSSNGIISGFYKHSLEESIANYINNLWQSLTDQEKEEIRRILNE